MRRLVVAFLSVFIAAAAVTAGVLMIRDEGSRRGDHDVAAAGPSPTSAAPSVPTTTAPTTTAPTTTVPTTTTAPPGTFPVKGEWTWTLATEDGYRTSGRLSLGAVSRVEDAPSLPRLDDPSELEADCDDFDPATDAVVPAELSLTNDTAGFANELSNTFYLGSTEADGVLFKDAPDGLLSVAALYSSGVDCEPIVLADEAWFDEGDGWGIRFDTAADPGQTLGPHYAMLILPDYYSPAQPQGDVGRLSSIGLVLVNAMRSDDAAVVSMTGPDAEVGNFGGGFMLSSLAR